MVPPLERLERREEPKAQGGEFVEAYVAKRTRQISPTRGACLGRNCNVHRIKTLVFPRIYRLNPPPLERLERREVTK